jgi:tetratricopeptide (TPR) repeat protein
LQVPAQQPEASALDTIAAHASAHRYAEALRIARLELSADPANSALRATLGSILFEWGRLREARADLAFATSATVPSLAQRLQLAWSCLMTGEPSESEQHMRAAVATADGAWEPHFGLGAALRAQSRFDESLTSLRAAQDRSPDNAAIQAEVVGTLIDAKRFAEALDAARNAARAHPAEYQALAMLGAALMWEDRFDEANAIYAEMAKLPAVDGDPSRLPIDAGFALRESGRVAEALAFYSQALPHHLDPGALVQYAFTLLKAGDLRRGLACYEFRWMFGSLLAQRLRLQRPTWAGQPLSGKTLLVTGEQGYGDVIQFLRYLPDVERRGARIVVLLRKPMRELVETMPCVETVIDLGQPLPHFDYQIPLLSLPHALGCELAELSNRGVPYLDVDREKAARWRDRVRLGAINVGIVWAGDPLGLRGRQKSLPLAMLEPLSTIPGVRLYSLQKGAAADEVSQAPATMRIVDLSAEIRDFADTAAMIDALDLIVSVCTSVAHLAGALGKPVWTLLAEPADWRWLATGSTTFWYPTMRLFRQSAPGDWNRVVAQVRSALASFDRNAPRGEWGSMATQPLPSWEVPVAMAEARHGIFEVRPEGSVSERSLHYYGEYLQQQLDVLARVVRAGATVFEVGSGVGAHAVPMATMIGPHGHIFVCESRPSLAQLLEHNLKANGVGWTTTIRSTLAGNRAPDGSIDDAAATIDELWLRRLECLKICEDVDALRVLTGAAETLWTSRCVVFSAVADDHAASEVARLLRDFGYHCMRVAVPRYDPANFNRRDDDVFGNGVGLAVFAVPEESEAMAATRGFPVLH